jgi:plasmid stabilization system protein ParE
VTRVSWHPHARQELFEGSDFYEEAEEGLGSALVESVESVVDHVARFPQAAPRIRHDVRQISVDGFPYNLVYQVDEQGVFVLAVAHQRRRPLYWAKRTRASS